MRQSCADLIGSVPGMVLDPNDDLFSTGIEWDAESVWSDPVPPSTSTPIPLTN
jgi:hypothetical protein